MILTRPNHYVPWELCWIDTSNPSNVNKFFAHSSIIPILRHHPLTPFFTFSWSNPRCHYCSFLLDFQRRSHPWPYLTYIALCIFIVTSYPITFLERHSLSTAVHPYLFALSSSPHTITSSLSSSLTLPHYSFLASLLELNLLNNIFFVLSALSVNLEKKHWKVQKDWEENRKIYTLSETILFTLLERKWN